MSSCIFSVHPPQHCVTCSLPPLPDCSSHLDLTTMEAVTMATPHCRIKTQRWLFASHPKPHLPPSNKLPTACSTSGVSYAASILVILQQLLVFHHPCLCYSLSLIRFYLEHPSAHPPLSYNKYTPTDRKNLMMSLTCSSSCKIIFLLTASTN